MNLIDFEGYNIASERVAVKKHSAQLREQIAQEIEAYIPDPHTDKEECSECRAFRISAKIARGK